MDKEFIILTAITTAVATLAYLFFQNQRHITNNHNVTEDNFNVYADLDCPICFEPMTMDGSSCALLDCGHFLHQNCLRDMNNARTSASETNKCPICRKPFRYP